MTILDELQSNTCTDCQDHHLANAEHIDNGWRQRHNDDIWPRPFQEWGVRPGAVKAIMVGQDPTIDSTRGIRYALEADRSDSRLGRFIREIVKMFPWAGFDQFYFTNLVKCRFDEKPGKNRRSISGFFVDIVPSCYTKFLRQEIASFDDLEYIITLGKDTFELLATQGGIDARRLGPFKDTFGKEIPFKPSDLSREYRLIPLPHLPTYDKANSYRVYARDEVSRRLARLPSPPCTAEGEVDGDYRGDQGISR